MVYLLHHKLLESQMTDQWSNARLGTLFAEIVIVLSPLGLIKYTYQGRQQLCGGHALPEVQVLRVLGGERT